LDLKKRRSKGENKKVNLPGKCTDSIQQPYLETTTAVAKVILNQEPTLQAWADLSPSIKSQEQLVELHAFQNENIV
jgi:hypothetical protein